MAEEKSEQETQKQEPDPNQVTIYPVKTDQGQERKAIDIESLKRWIMYKMEQANPFYINTENIDKLTDFENLVYSNMFGELNEVLDKELGINKSENEQTSEQQQQSSNKEQQNKESTFEGEEPNPDDGGEDVVQLDQ